MPLVTELKGHGAGHANDARDLSRLGVGYPGIEVCGAIATGVHLQIPPGHVGLVWPRSGLALRHGLDTLAGVIDSDYRGEVRVILVNHGTDPVRIEAGDRIAQLLVQRVERVAFTRTESLHESARGEGGFGSTGR